MKVGILPLSTLAALPDGTLSPRQGIRLCEEMHGFGLDPAVATVAEARAAFAGYRARIAADRSQVRRIREQVRQLNAEAREIEAGFRSSPAASPE